MLYVCMKACMYIHICTHARGEQGVSILGAVRSYLTWLLGTELSDLNFQASSLTCFNFYNQN